jgi:hypothetical protein
MMPSNDGFYGFGHPLSLEWNDAHFETAPMNKVVINWNNSIRKYEWS